MDLKKNLVLDQALNIYGLKLIKHPDLPFCSDLHTFVASLSSSKREIIGIGTDLNPELAVVKAIGESIERYSMTDACLTSNGIAAHNIYEEAMCRALFELIERDAFLVRWFSKLTPSRIVMDYDDTWHHKMISKMEKNNYKVFLFEISLDIPLPICTILIRTPKNAMCIGMGIGWNLERALFHAFCESLRSLGHANQRMTDLQNINCLSVKKVEFGIEDHEMFFWSIENMEYFNFMIKSPNSCLYSDLSSSTKWLQSFEELMFFLTERNHHIEFRNLGRNVLNSPFHSVRCVSTTLQNLFFGPTVNSVINKKRLNQLGLTVCNRVIHPIH